MQTNFQMVREFHEKFAIPILSHTGVPLTNRIELRNRLIDEEFHEFQESIDWPHFVPNQVKLVDVADSLADLLYHIYGTALEFGIDIDKVFAEVHRSNLTKLDDDGKPFYRDDGKILKGDNYESPRIAEILYEST